MFILKTVFLFIFFVKKPAFIYLIVNGENLILKPVLCKQNLAEAVAWCATSILPKERRIVTTDFVNKPGTLTSHSTKYCTYEPYVERDVRKEYKLYPS